jgi:hypothetical protein
MYTRDYILRMIEQLKKAIATILRLGDEQRIEEALDTLGDTYDELLGHPPGALASLTVQSAAMTLGKWHRIRIYGSLLETEAEVLCSRGGPSDLVQAARLRLRALQLTLLGLDYGGRGDPALADRAKELLAKVDRAALDAKSEAALRELKLLK